MHSRRQVISGLQTVESAHKLVDQLAPKMTGRVSGHVRIEKLNNRRGDNAEIAKVTFVDDLKDAPVAKPAKKAETKTEAKPVAKKAPAKKATQAKEKI